MEVKLDKRYPVASTIEQAWAVLRDVHATAACMPGAQITEQLGPTLYKGMVKAKVGPATMLFNGEIEVQGIDTARRALAMLGKGADKAGSSAQMQLTAHLELGAGAADCVLVGLATVTVAGKLAQLGSRLLVPVSDAMLAQFADNFRAAAAAVAPAAAAPVAPPAAVTPGFTAARKGAGQPDFMETTIMRLVEGGQAPGRVDPQPAQAASAPAATAQLAPRPAAPVKELNVLALAWAVIKGWIAGLFSKKA